MEVAVSTRCVDQVLCARGRHKESRKGDICHGWVECVQEREKQHVGTSILL